MSSSHQTDLEAVELIKSTINQYNGSVEPEEYIAILHSGTSDALELIGITAVVTRANDSKIVTIPTTIMSRMHLRKEYGIPILEENHIKSKDKHNYRHLSIMKADEDGISTCYHSIMNIKRPLNVADVHKAITETILNLHADNYIRNLKTLLVLMTYMMLMDSKGSESAEKYLTLLENERSILESELRGRINDIRLFDKYVARIKNVLDGHTIPFHADDNFRKGIEERYPILFCAVIDPNNSHTMRLDAVKIMFTPHEHVNKLKNKVEKMNLNIHVQGYVPPIVEDELTKTANQAEMNLLNANTLTELTTLIEKNPNLLAAEEICKAKIKNCLDTHFHGQGEDHFAMAVLLMKKVPTNVLAALSPVLINRFNFNLYEVVQYKDRKNKNYINTLCKIISEEYFSRLNDLSYLKSILALRLNPAILDNNALFNYGSDVAKLEETIIPKSDAFNKRHEFLLETMSRLQHVYKILNKEKASDPENVNINKHIDFVKRKYTELLKEYKKISSSLPAAMMVSELYKMNEERKLIFLLFFSPTKPAETKPPIDRASRREHN